MAKEVQNSRSGEIKQTAEDLDEFLNKVDQQFFYVSNPLLFMFNVYYVLTFIIVGLD